MKIEMALISKELIKPFDPTPKHLCRHQLSYLDQLLFSIYMPSIFFYNNNAKTSQIEICNIVKKSLSKVLSMYYPLAGRIKDDIYVDCNDKGVLFVESQANCLISDILQRSNPNDCNVFLPLKSDEPSDLACFAQITFFKCGGFAISFALNHKLGDALSIITFFNNWAAIARGDKISPPIFDLATLFPPKDLSWYRDRAMLFTEESIVLKRFVFDALTIAALKAKYKNKTGYNVSRTEALSAFIVSRILASTKSRTSYNHYNFTQAVNLRPRMDPPLPENYFGNIMLSVRAQIIMDAKDEECCGMIGPMKEAVRNINEMFVKNIQETNDHLNIVKEMNDHFAKGEEISFLFSSLCNFPTNETDFGWGKPVGGAILPIPCKDTVFLTDIKDRQGIEAWIQLKKEDMAKFENDKVLLAHIVSPIPHSNFTC